jgi:hypothetical protein
MPTKLLGESRAVRHAAVVNHRCKALGLAHNLANAISFTLTAIAFVRMLVFSRRIGELYVIVYARLGKPATFYCQQNYSSSAPPLAFASTTL